jgi:hypothetical protein
MTQVVAAFLGPGVSIDKDSFADLTDVPVKRVTFAPDGTGRLAVVFEGDLLPDVRAAVRRRMQATTPGEETLLSTLADAETPPSPTLAERVTALEARVATLSKLVLGDTD